jgi:hypothetical protein
VIVPSRSARIVAIEATRNDNPKASQKSARSNNVPNQRVVNPGGGNRNDASSVVKAYRKIIAIGK